MKRLLAMALLVLELVWFDAAFMEHGALVWPLPQPKGGVYALAWLNNTDCLLVAQNQVEPDEQRRNQYTYDFYLQSGNQPPRLVGSLPAGVFLRWLQVLPLSDGLMLDLHWRDELWFYDERSQTIQRQPDADRPQPEEGEYMNAFWLGHGLYLLSGDLAGGGVGLSLYDSRTGQEQPLAELQFEWEIAQFAPGAYLGPQAGRGRWLALNWLGELVEITLPEPEGDLPAEARLWQAAEQWPLPEPDKNCWYWHFGPVQGRNGDCWLLEVILPGRQSALYQLVDLQSGELQASLELPCTEAENYNFLDVYGSKLYFAQSTALDSFWGNKIWEYDCQTGERQLIWQDNLTRWRNLVFDGYDMPDYIGSGTVSPDGKELLFCSSQGYVRRLALASCGKAAGLVNVRFSAQTKEERAALVKEPLFNYSI